MRFYSFNNYTLFWISQASYFAFMIAIIKCFFEKLTIVGIKFKNIEDRKIILERVLVLFLLVWFFWWRFRENYLSIYWAGKSSGPILIFHHSCTWKFSQLGFSSQNKKLKKSLFLHQLFSLSTKLSSKIFNNHSYNHSF